MLLFLALDEALGEDGTELWIGALDIVQKPLDRSASTLKEIQDEVPVAAVEQGWPASAGLGTLTAYESTAGEKRSRPRSDVTSGVTCALDHLARFNDGLGRVPDPLAGTGAQYAYLEIPRATMEIDGQSNNDAKILELRDSIAAQLEGATPSARLTGYAIGTENLYVDFLLLDREAATEEFREALSSIDSVKDATLFRFANGDANPVVLKAP
jgi:hypothetical protein